MDREELGALDADKLPVLLDKLQMDPCTKEGD